MTVDESTGAVRHGTAEKQNYHVPFFIMTDDSDVHQNRANEISAFKFINIFARMTGISADQVKPIEASTIKSEQIRVVNGDRMVDYKSLPSSKIIN